MKVVKNRAYFKRYQVKFKRRREGKTDYYARKRLVIQDKNKYNTPKNRLIVRFTNTDIIAQVGLSFVVYFIQLYAFTSCSGGVRSHRGRQDPSCCVCTRASALRSESRTHQLLRCLLHGTAPCQKGTPTSSRHVCNKHSPQILTKYGLGDKYEGVSEVTGEEYNVEAMGGGPRPFRCFLDVGLTRTTTGNRVFAVMKGAIDGGLEVPHK